ncbi:protocatechuate 3,4-dioxygenase subunit alpha, partial [Kitasatospora sp. NPDC059088]|uniref:protocatechuate 3,4-dioxygenase subunit alpha n=1 Tax=Kitasatospora sp. NPDC059088 TaxID=3346722 RepID=UPI0036CAE2D8
GAGAPVPDALLSSWPPAPEGSLTGVPGSLRRAPGTGAVLGRTGVDFTGFGRVATGSDGGWTLRTLAPGAHRDGATPYLAVCVFARGLLQHLYTRIYLPEQVTALAADPVLGELPTERRATLVATAERDGVYHFDIRLQAGDGPDEETVFLEFA